MQGGPLALPGAVCDTGRVPESLAGRLLIATPLLTDPNFARAIVFLCAHDENGAFGVVINRPLEGFEVIDHLHAWAALAAAPAVLFSGGPVDKSVAVGLGRFRQPWAPGQDPQFPPGMAMMDLSHEPADTGAIACVRVFVGYSGWGAGQLEREIEEEAWFVVAADAADPFSEHPDRLWRDVLQRQAGKLAMFAYFPSDPRAN